MAFNIGIKDIIDIILTAFLLYGAFKLLKRSGALNVFLGIMTFIIIWFVVSKVLRMELLGEILDGLVSVGAFALIVLFQEEIRRFFSRLGSRKNWGILNYFKKFLKGSENEQIRTDYDLIQIVIACRNLSKTATGGLIIVTRTNDLEFYTQSAEIIDARISSRLIENIFFKNSPLHDGAMVISDFKIWAAGCVLPVSENPDLPKRIGMRHRAAAGITEQVDVHVIIVSEETGRVSHAQKGKIDMGISPQQLVDIIDQVFGDL